MVPAHADPGPGRRPGENAETAAPSPDARGARDAVYPTGLPGLSVLPAGAWDLAARQALAGDRWRIVKAELEADFDFVVVDSGPVLFVSDSLLMARGADGVLLSVLLDVSRVS